MFDLLKFFKRRRLPEIITPKPVHVAVIMDGNGRWANSKGLSRVAGHKRGVDAVKNLIKGCLHHEIPHLSIFAFSSENWNRPQSEVSALMELLTSELSQQTLKLLENGFRLNLLGDLEKLDPKIQKLAHDAMLATKENTKLQFNVAINYGGRWDILQATKAIAKEVKEGRLEIDDIDADAISDRLSTNSIPDPDLYIRTSGEYRISNFMLWQAAYSEFFFLDVLWPDFDEEAFTEVLFRYTHRDRRFGGAVDKMPHGLNEELAPNKSSKNKNKA
ncbi:MAG: polyprenyl diphosphate synthase [Pseudomonadota bacterium]